ncbi:MAG: hypothetical protein NC203_06220 [Firmicutes bacterium]|nr:hypothetical protein [[Eubacterium] siraeum]MCM1487941.1 hypothetical protein [Bacillota bacterium]
MSILKLRKRLFRNDGSVLFAVLVIMSMLIIAATATYYVVNNQNASIEVHYASEQSYQAARSLSQTVSDFLDKQFEDIMGRGATVPISSFNTTLAGKIINGSSIDSQVINLAAYGYSSDDSAKVEITNNTGGPVVTLPDTTRKYYEVKITATVNGETTTLTQLRHFDIGPTKYFTRFLTCTGNRPDDTRVAAGDVYGDAYFENTYTEFMDGNTTFHRSIYANGNVMDIGGKYEPDAGEYIESVVRGNYLINSSGGSSVNTPYVFVGGDMINKGKYVNSKAVYVGGNYTAMQTSDNDSVKYFINGDCNIGSSTVRTNGVKGTFYVNGELYINSDGGAGSMGTFYVTDMSKVHLGDGYHEGCATIIVDSTKFENDIKGTNPTAGIESWADVTSYIAKKTSKNTYQTWDAETYFDNNLRSTAVTVDPSVDLVYSGVGGENDGHGNTLWPGSPMIYETDSNIILKSPGWATGKIILDASDHDIYVYLDGGSENKFELSASCPIITKGDHSVIFVLPEDTDFKMQQGSFMGNLELLKTIDTSLTEDNGSNGIYNAYRQCQIGSAENKTNAANAIAVQGTKVINDGLDAYLDADGELSTDAYITTPGANNNLFIVTKGSSNTIDVGAGGILGYLYAPDANLKVDASSNGLAFVGGIISGSYTYKNPSAGLVFAKPNDYGNVYGGQDIVTYLMGQANNAGGTPSPTATIDLKDPGIGGDGYK